MSAAAVLAVLAESGHSHPEAAAEGRPRHDEQPLAAGEEDWQARERLINVGLVNAGLVL